MARSLVFRILCVSAFLSVLASGTQIYAGYSRDKSDIVEQVINVNQGLKGGFEHALATDDPTLIQTLLLSVYNLDAVKHVSLRAADGQIWSLGQLDPTVDWGHSLQLFQQDGVQRLTDAGSVFIGVSFTDAKARRTSQIWIILISNFLETVCAAVVIFGLFDRAVTRHLNDISRHVVQGAWQSNTAPLVLDRAKPVVADDLDRITDAINAAKRQSREEISALEQEVQRREAVETQLRVQAGSLADLNRETEQFAYAISHDLKAPANTLYMLLDELRHLHSPHMPLDVFDVLEDAQRTVSRMMTLIEDVLSYARAAGSDCVAQSANLNHLLDEVFDDLRADLKAADCEVPHYDLPVVWGDATQLRLLLQNLLSNAIKFRHPDRQLRLEIVLRPDPDFTILQIKDNGIGIPKDHQLAVFEMFNRLHPQSQYGGAGLGLSLCRRIAERHNGQIIVLSEDGEGACFEVMLPKEPL